MAAKVDMGLQLQVENVKHLPPRAPSSNGRPLSGCFQNRGRLFSTPNHHHLSDNCTQSTQTFSGHSSPQHHVPVQGSANHSVPTTFKNRRIQSAKARLETSTSQCIADTFACDTVVVPGSNIAVYDVNRNLALDHKPVKRRGSGKDSYLYTHEISAVRSASRPSSAKSGWTSAPVSPAVASEQTEELVPEDLKPSVYGYRLKRQVYGSNPDIFTPCQQPLQLHTMLKLDNRPNIPSEGDAKGDQSNSRGCGTRAIPSHLEPLRPWLNQTVPEEVTGVNPTTCLVFLPLNQLFDDLPVVPLS